MVGRVILASFKSLIRNSRHSLVRRLEFARHKENSPKRENVPSLCKQIAKNGNDKTTRNMFAFDEDRSV
jgi:hypothetical protein